MNHQKILELAIQLPERLGPEFIVVPGGRYLAIIHPELGTAALVVSDNREQAKAAAADLTAKSADAGVTAPAMHFGISSGRIEPPWLIRDGSGMAIDIAVAMAKGAQSRPPLGVEAAAKISAAVGGNGEKPDTDNKAVLSPHMVRLAEACVEKALDGRSVWVAGVPIDIKDVASPSFLLPAVLIDAALTWTIPVVARNGNGGFLVRMTPDPKAVLGYRVTGLDASAPLLLFLPFVNIIRRSFANDECILDGTVQRFSDFLSDNGLENGILEDVDVRVAAS